MYRGERFNSATHLLGTALSIVGAAALVAHATRDGDLTKGVAAAVFGATLVLLYAASTLYHAWRGAWKPILRRLDHCAIFLLIAGTYTPFSLVTLRGPLGTSMLVVIWAMAAWGIRRAWRTTDGRDPSPWPYAAMGWLGMTTIVPLWEQLGVAGLSWLALGGIAYSAGIVFYINDTRWRHAHGIWHLFVMGGSAAHFVAILWFVL